MIFLKDDFLKNDFFEKTVSKMITGKNE